MPLTQDELKEVSKKFSRFKIDAEQGWLYCQNSKYDEGLENFSKALDAFKEVIEKIKS